MHDLVRDPRDVFRRHHAVLTAPHSRMITSSLCTRNRSASVGERIGAPRTVPPRPAPRADSLNAAERSFYSPERSSVRVCSRSGRIEHLTVWHVWSSGVARGARTHPEWTWLVGTYRRRASERKSRGCGECGCSSVLLIAILGHHSRAAVVGATININAIIMRLQNPLAGSLRGS